MEFLGHKIDSSGVHPTDDKIESITKALSPQNLTQLKTYLGLYNLYMNSVRAITSLFGHRNMKSVL